MNPFDFIRCMRLTVSDAPGTWSMLVDPKDYDPRLDYPYRIIDVYRLPIFDRYRLASATAGLARASGGGPVWVPLRHR